MNDLTKLGKATEIIGKSIFYILIVILFILVIGLSLMKFENRPVITTIVATLLGNLFLLIIAFLLLRALFRPIYNLNKNIQLFKYEEIHSTEFKEKFATKFQVKWIFSLICSILITLLLRIPTFGVSILLFIPQFILLFKSKGLWN